MKTQYFHVDKNKPDKQILKEAAMILRQGGLVAFPTETVYGLGANGLEERAVSRIFQAKGRPGDNPLILHIADRGDLGKLVKNVPANARALMERFWPGPLTIVLERDAVVPDVTTGGLDTVAIRLPDCVVARELIELAGVPVAAPSANTSGRPSPTSATAVLADMDGRIDVVLDGGACDIGLESTVVDCSTPAPTLLRPGGVTLEMLTEVLGFVEFDQNLVQPDAAPRSPGMKYRHYAPTAPLTLIEGDCWEQVLAVLESEIRQAVSAGKKVGAAVSRETAEKLAASGSIAAIFGSRGNVGEYAANLYDVLRSFDDTDVNVIFAEGIQEAGLGLAVMNRLRKASGYRIIQA